MRLVALVLTLGFMSAGCAIEAGDPSTAEEPQRHAEIVAIAGSARPITPVEAPTSAPTNAPHAQSITAAGGLPAAGAGEGSGSTIQADNPNPSPWDPHGNGH